MADIIRRVAVLAVNRASYGNLHIPIRTIFSSSGIGIDSFKLSREQHASRYAPSLDGFKKRFLDSIGQSDSQIFTEDLRNMIMSANNDQEINAVIQALKKYDANKVKLTDYHFGSPIMRLLYIQNKIDLGLQLYMDEDLKGIFNDSASALVLMNKLIEDKRYDDVLKVFEHGTKRGFSTSSGRVFPTDVVMLAIEALYRQNTKESLVKAKELVSKVRERDNDINSRAATMTALLAVQQGEPSFAMEILGAVRSQNLSTVQNIRAICYAEMGRVEEAINVVHLLAEQSPANADRRRVFPLVMRHIRSGVERTNDSNLLTRFEELSKFVLKNNRLSTIDLPEFVSEPIDRRAPGRQNTQQNMRGSFQRTVGNLRNRGEFNQRTDNFRQGNMGGFYRQSGGYNRDNRFGNNNFQRQDFNYDRRSQNNYVDGYQRNNGNDRYSPRNRNSSFNEYSRQDGRNQRQQQDQQQENQSFSRYNRNEGGFASTRRNEFSNSSNSQRSMEGARNMEDDINTTQSKRTRQGNEDDQTREQGSWERSTRQ